MVLEPRLRMTYGDLRTFDLSLSGKDGMRLERVRGYIAREGWEKTPPKLKQSWTFDLDAPSSQSSPSSEGGLNQTLDLESQTQLVDIPLESLATHSSTSSPTPLDSQIPLSQLHCLTSISPFSITSSVEQGHNFRAWDFAFEDMSVPHIAGLVSIPFIVFTAYGLLHILPAWTGFAFPSPIEKELWLVSCYLLISPLAAGVGFLAFIVLASVVFACMLCFPSKGRKNGKEKEEEDRVFEGMLRPLMYVFMVLVLGYFMALVLARGYLMVEAGMSLRRERVGMFETKGGSWLDYWPHI